MLGGDTASLIGARRQSDLHGLRCYGVDYRTPPEHPYPATLDDCVPAYRYVLERHAPANIVLTGRSAGGNLAATMLLRGAMRGCRCRQASCCSRRRST